MKNINYIIEGILAIAIIILFVMQLTGTEGLKSAKPAFIADGDTAKLLPVAYVNLDSLLQNYNYYKDLNEIVMRKEENARANINQQASRLQSELQDFERKVNNNAFLTRERAEQEQQRLIKKQQELQALDSRLSQELLAEHNKLNEQLRDSLIAQLKVFNQGKNYQIIFSNIANDNLLLANDAYDITAELLTYLNKHYSPSGRE
jgi:outer membrane protein